uniref:Uncharacterized protein n=1 Tax=Arundo donax TaxID=35708 RepID=A0A0A8YBU0_ARUDO
MLHMETKVQHICTCTTHE